MRYVLKMPKSFGKVERISLSLFFMMLSYLSSLRKTTTVQSICYNTPTLMLVIFAGTGALCVKLRVQ